MAICLDNNLPRDYCETGLYTGSGNLYSRWADKSSLFVMFRNGRFGCVGEHSCYDGTISMSFDVFMQLSFIENPEPDWNAPVEFTTDLQELTFDVDEHILKEINKMEKISEERVSNFYFKHFNK